MGTFLVSRVTRFSGEELRIAQTAWLVERGGGVAPCLVPYFPSLRIAQNSASFFFLATGQGF